MTSDEKQLHRGRIAVVVLLASVVAGMVVAVALHGHDALSFLTNGSRVQEQAERLGPLAPLVFGALVVVQEVTVVVPSEPLELAAGYAFGFWKGALVYAAASVAGCLAIIGIVNLVGNKVLQLVLSEKRRSRLRALHRSQGFDTAVLLAFFVPGLPKDVLAYIGALSGMKPIRLVALTTLGRLPSIMAVTWASSLAARGDWWMAATVFAGVAAAALVALLIYHRRERHHGHQQEKLED